MDGQNQVSSNSRTELARKSWTAYLMPTAFLIGVLYVINRFYWQLGSHSLLFVVPIVFWLYQIVMIRSYVLFIDKDGVWVSFGVFPWNKGEQGSYWRDSDDALYLPGFLSWIFRSYLIVIRHRFTLANEIRLTHMHLGHDATGKINNVISRKRRRNS
jgi:hypothetical protein